MSLYIKPENQMIYMRRGDAGVIRFVFDRPMDDIYTTFAVKRHQSDRDEDAVITKTFLCGSDRYISPYVAVFYLCPCDTYDLEVEPVKDKFDYQDYVWMLKLESDHGRLADTVIPCRTMRFPKFRLYYGSVPDFEIK